MNERMDGMDDYISIAGYICDHSKCGEIFLQSHDGTRSHLLEEIPSIAMAAEKEGWTRWTRKGRVYTYCPKHARRFPRFPFFRGFEPTWERTTQRRLGVRGPQW